MTINFPVRFNEKFEIVDCYGNILVPDVRRFKYDQSGLINNDLDHMERQKEIGEWLVNLINRYEQVKEGSQDGLEQAGNGQKTEDQAVQVLSTGQAEKLEEKPVSGRQKLSHAERSRRARERALRFWARKKEKAGDP